jgi:hypothetical protein
VLATQLLPHFADNKIMVGSHVRSVALLALIACSSAAAAPVPAARHRQAVSVNTAGLRLLKSGQTARAAQHFRDAIALDPEYALARYNLACASSVLRDFRTALAALEWLAARPNDPVAKARMDKALTDPDLDFVSVLPEARKLLQVPLFSTEHPLPWLAERDGTWSAELPMTDCSARSYTFKFASDGLLELTVRESCVGAPAKSHSWEGTLEPHDDGTIDVTVEGWSQWPSNVRLALAACPGLEEAAGSCFMLTSDKTDIGPFHRGAPGMSPLVAHKKEATKNLALSTGN